LDLEQTFEDEKFFNSKSNLDAIERVCVAYACRNPAINYSQGFTHVVGRIYSVLQEEEMTFWIFVQLLETDYLPIDYFQ
jgi:hypothetical protein